MRDLNTKALAEKLRAYSQNNENEIGELAYQASIRLMTYRNKVIRLEAKIAEMEEEEDDGK